MTMRFACAATFGLMVFLGTATAAQASAPLATFRQLAPFFEPDGVQSATRPQAAETDQTHRLAPADCKYPLSGGADPTSAVKDVIARFNVAVTCGDLAAAQALVADDGTVSELGQSMTDEGKPVSRIETGSWAEQLVLFTRSVSGDSRTHRERAVLGEASVLIDGASALVRQPIRSEIVGEPSQDLCLIQHFMLIDDGKGWKIRHMMLVPLAEGCAQIPPQQ